MSRTRRTFAEYGREDLDRVATILTVLSAERAGEFSTICVCGYAHEIGFDPRIADRESLLALHAVVWETTSRPMAPPGSAWFIIANMALRKAVT